MWVSGSFLYFIQTPKTPLTCTTIRGFLKDQHKYFRLAGPMFSVATTELCWCSTKAAIDCTWVGVALADKTLFTEQVVGLRAIVCSSLPFWCFFPEQPSFWIFLFILLMAYFVLLYFTLCFWEFPILFWELINLFNIAIYPASQCFVVEEFFQHI